MDLQTPQILFTIFSHIPYRPPIEPHIENGCFEGSYTTKIGVQQLSGVIPSSFSEWMTIFSGTFVSNSYHDVFKNQLANLMFDFMVSSIAVLGISWN